MLDNRFSILKNCAMTFKEVKEIIDNTLNEFFCPELDKYIVVEDKDFTEIKDLVIEYSEINISRRKQFYFTAKKDGKNFASTLIEEDELDDKFELYYETSNLFIFQKILILTEEGIQKYLQELKKSKEFTWDKLKNWATELANENIEIFNDVIILTTYKSSDNITTNFSFSKDNKIKCAEVEEGNYIIAMKGVSYRKMQVIISSLVMEDKE